jgi:uncharacterized protein
MHPIESADGLKHSDRAQICAVLERFMGVRSAILYGSRAMGNFKPYSDIDLAIVGDVSERDIAAIAGELEELPLPYKFDVLALEGIQLPALRQHVADHGRVFWTYQNLLNATY